MRKTLTKTAASSCRLDTFLKKELSLTKRQISQAKFRRDGILVNGVRQRITYPLCPGDTVEICLEENDLSSGHLLSYDRPLDILYEDEDILAVNKPSGLVVHPSHGHYQDTLANMVRHYYQSRNQTIKVRPVGRLDKDTSGIVLFAKNQAAAMRLNEQKQAGICAKTYYAIVHGTVSPAEGKICFPLEKDETALNKMKISADGRAAETYYKTRLSSGGNTLLEITIKTGRTHQIRAHMAGIGYPLLGDPVYGGASSFGHTALHAGKAVFRQPFSGKTITVKAPLPEDVSRLLSCDKVSI